MGRTCRPTPTRIRSEHIAWLLAERLGALVAPPVAYGISKTFEYFPGTISLSIPTYQAMLFEIGAALVRQGFGHLIILNGNRPNGTANDAVARHIVDELDTQHDFKVSAVSYWEPARRARSMRCGSRSRAAWGTAANSRPRSSSRRGPSWSRWSG